MADQSRNFREWHRAGDRWYLWCAPVNNFHYGAGGGEQNRSFPRYNGRAPDIFIINL